MLSSAPNGLFRSIRLLNSHQDALPSTQMAHSTITADYFTSVLKADSIVPDHIPLHHRSFYEQHQGAYLCSRFLIPSSTRLFTSAPESLYYIQHQTSNHYNRWLSPQHQTTYVYTTQLIPQHRTIYLHNGRLIPLQQTTYLTADGLFCARLFSYTPDGSLHSTRLPTSPDGSFHSTRLLTSRPNGSFNSVGLFTSSPGSSFHSNTLLTTLLHQMAHSTVPDCLTPHRGLISQHSSSCLLRNRPHSSAPDVLQPHQTDHTLAPDCSPLHQTADSTASEY